MTIYTDEDFELDGRDFYLSGASADFDYDTEYCTDDDFTGWALTGCELVSIRLGGITLTRYQAVEMTNEAEIDAIEQRIAQAILEDVNAGQLLAAE